MLFKKLVGGESINLNGTTITPEMVMMPSIPGPSVLLLNAHHSAIYNTFSSSILQPLLSSFGLTRRLTSSHPTLSVIYFNHAPSLPSTPFSSLPSSITVITPSFSSFSVAHTASTLLCAHLHLVLPSLFSSFPFSFPSPSFPKHLVFLEVCHNP